MSYLMNEAQAVQFFEDLAQMHQCARGVETNETQDAFKKSSDRVKETMVNWQINMLKLIEADENQANPSRLPPPGVDVTTPDYDPRNDWPTDANRLIDEGEEVRALASLLYAHASRLSDEKEFIICTWLPTMLGGVAHVIDKDGNEIPGANEPRNMAGASREEKQIAFVRSFIAAVRYEFMSLARQGRR